MTTEQGPVTILVGVDGSEASVEALRQAAWLAKPLNARVTALTRWNHPSAHECPTRWVASISRGQARPTLIEAGRNAALLVLGRRGMGGFRGLRPGHVTAAGTAHAHCPVAVVHTAKAGEHHA